MTEGRLLQLTIKPHLLVLHHPFILWGFSSYISVFDLLRNDWVKKKYKVHQDQIIHIECVKQKDGRTLWLTVGSDKVIQFLDFDSLEIVKKREIRRQVSACAWKEDWEVFVADKFGDLFTVNIAEESRNECIKSYETANCLDPQNSTVHFSHISEITVFRKTSKLLLTGDKDEKIRIGQASPNPQKTLHYLVGHRGCIMDILVLEDEQLVVSSSSDYTMRLWDLDTGLLLHEQAIFGLPRRLVSTGEKSEVLVLVESYIGVCFVKIKDRRFGETRRMDLEYEPVAAIVGEESVNSPKRLLFWVNKEGTLLVHDMDEGKEVKRLGGLEFEENKDRVVSVVVKNSERPILKKI